jgi:hypothetical protein
MQQQRDECPTISRYLMWKEGNSGNLQQFVDDVFPSYYEWIHNHVLSHDVAFKGPPPSESVEVSTLTSRQLKVLHSTVERIALSGMDDQTLPGSRFSGQRSPYESMVHHAMTMSEILREWVVKALDTLVTGTYFYFYPGWTQETLDAYLLAYVSVFDQTMRDFINLTTLTAKEVDQMRQLDHAAFLLCSTIATTHRWTCPAAPTFTAVEFTDDRTPRSDVPLIPGCISRHPADPDGGIPYAATSLLNEQGVIILFGAVWIEKTRVAYTARYGPDSEATDAPVPQEAWRTSST